MLFEQVIHEDFKRIITQHNDESEPLWSPEKGFRNERLRFPARTSRGFSIGFLPILNKTDKENICALKTFKLYVHKPNEIPTPFHESIYLNYEEYLEIKVFPKSFTTDEGLQRFPPFSRKCYFEGERKLKFFRTYSKALCEWECKANLVVTFSYEKYLIFYIVYF